MNIVPARPRSTKGGTTMIWVQNGECRGEGRTWVLNSETVPQNTEVALPPESLGLKEAPCPPSLVS
jgi:hypothetical protein